LFVDVGELPACVLEEGLALFLTETRAFEVIQAKYCDRIGGVTVACLADGKEFAA
jgi:hypothetical protein